LLVWFFLWKSEDNARRTQHDCDVCVLQDVPWYKNRVCFHPFYGKEEYPILVPTFNEGSPQPGPSELKTFDTEEFLEWLYEVNQNNLPNMSAFQIVLRFFREPKVCVSGLVDFELGTMIDLEDACHTYHVLPYSGGLFDQPLYIMEAFQTIRGTKNKYEAEKLKSLESTKSEIETPKKLRK
jgi:hypothetical protein